MLCGQVFPSITGVNGGERRGDRCGREGPYERNQMKKVSWEEKTARPEEH